jgi:RNA polymerase sigma factor (sigma-70 family)
MALVTRDADDELRGRVVVSAQSDDDAAFAQVVAAHHEDMRRVCVVVCGDETIAEEAVNAAWAIAWRKLASIRDPARLRPWLISIAVNEARQLLRRRRRRWLVEIGPDSSFDRGGQDPAETIDAIDLRNALKRLDPDERALLGMRYVAGFDATELSVATGLSPAGTRARLARLLAKLSRELG